LIIIVNIKLLAGFMFKKLTFDVQVFLTFEALAKLFLKVSPGFTWGYSRSTPTGLILLKE